MAGLSVDTIRDNTRRGLKHARAQGRLDGRPTVMTQERVTAAVQLRDGGASVSAIARSLGVGASSVTRALTRHDLAHAQPKVGRIENAKLRAEEIVREELLIPPTEIRDQDQNEDLGLNPARAELTEFWRSFTA